MSQRDQAYDAFTRHLLEKKLLPGQFVTQRELVDITAMPLGAIREMIPRLEAEGLLKAFAQRGLQVVHIDLRMVREAFQLREFIELAAVQAYARSGAPSGLARQRAAHEKIRQAAERGVTRAMLDEAQGIDWAFHDFFVGALDNELLNNVHRVNSIRIRLIMQERIGLTADRVPIVLEQHARIMDAVDARDPALAAEAMLAHLSSSRKRALDWAAGFARVEADA